MARKVTQDAVNAFIAGRTGRFGSNTTVELDTREVIVLKLHGNAIARRDTGPMGTFEVCDGGWWCYSTSKEYLNGLPGVRVNQKDYAWFLNGEPWDGEWRTINP